GDPQDRGRDGIGKAASYRRVQLGAGPPCRAPQRHHGHRPHLRRLYRHRELQGTHVRRTHPRHEGNDRTLGAADRGARDTHRRRFRARQDHRPEGPPLTPELLWTRFPYLWHMAEPGSWPAIRDHGLLSTSALLDRYGIMGEARDV